MKERKEKENTLMIGTLKTRPGLTEPRERTSIFLKKSVR